MLWLKNCCKKEEHKRIVAKIMFLISSFSSQYWENITNPSWLYHEDKPDHKAAHTNKLFQIDCSRNRYASRLEKVPVGLAHETILEATCEHGSTLWTVLSRLRSVAWQKLFLYMMKGPKDRITLNMARCSSYEDRHPRMLAEGDERKVFKPFLLTYII